MNAAPRDVVVSLPPIVVAEELVAAAVVVANERGFWLRNDKPGGQVAGASGEVRGVPNCQ